MTQAQDPAAYVHEGFWLNQSKGNTQGLTLTLRPLHANLLIAVLALFVRMSGGQLWTIVRFTLHQIRASARSQPLSMLHNQQQIILRNATTDLATARLVFCLAWSGRKKIVKSFSSSMVLVLVAIFHSAFFWVAGGLSSSATNAGQTVLSRSPFCGVWNGTYFETASNGPNITTDETFHLSVEFASNAEHDVQLSLEYAEQCYMSSQASSYYTSTCTSIYQQPRLNWTTYPGSCPFSSQMCSDMAKTIVLETQWIDSHDDLGINSDYNDRLRYRRITNCTVLDDTAYVTDWVNVTNSTDVQTPWKIAYANYGPSIPYGTNWTYAYSNFADFYTPFTGLSTTSYQVGSELAYGESSGISDSPGLRGSTFVPVPELEQLNADLVLLFLSYTGSYTEQIDDPWFLAHQIHHETSKLPLARTIWTRDRPISTLACTEQHQFCTSRGECTPLLGFYQVQDVASFNSALTAKQNVTNDRILRAATASSLREVVGALALTANPMLALNSTAVESHTLSLPLPSNQWQLEVDRWHAIVMAHFQRTFVEWETGQIAAQTQYLMPPSTAADSWICQNLMLRGTGYQSFSVLALTLIVGFGTLIITISLTIENLASCVQKRFSRGSTGRTMWDDHEMLRLQESGDLAHQLPSRHSSSSTPEPFQKSGQSLELAITPQSLGLQKTLRHSGEGLKRSSSQALPPADRALLFSVGRTQSPSLVGCLGSDPGVKPYEDSSIAISLHSNDHQTPEMPRMALGFRDSPLRSAPARDEGRILRAAHLACYREELWSGSRGTWI